MRRNTQQHGTESRSIQRSVQVVLTISGIVFLLAGLILAASGASVSSAIGSVTDRFDDSSQPADDIDSSNGDAADGGSSGNETDDTDGGDSDTGDSGDSDTGDSGDSDTGDGDTGDGDTGDGGDGDTGDGGDGDGDSDDGNTDGDDSDGGDNGDSSDDDGTHALTVSVVDQDGNAVDGADVSLDDFSSDEKTTGGDGEVEWEVEDGTYGVTANADGYQSAEDNVEIDGDDESIELTLEEEDNGSGNDDGSGDDDSSDDGSSDGSSTMTFVVEDQNGNTLDNATVALEREMFGEIRGKEEKTVDQNGEVDFERENGDYALTVTVDGTESEEQTITFDGDDRMVLEYETTDN
ncbi:carboxypeptidase regulatory-like domain-containing protein [Natrinema soli]|uniref:Carboxypeptidase regulatory-like domain-containing protein n=1 Tax=Natrinema soli TaxID=1930624 RepID=A0ABD5SRU9_9EURY|nr:carboxypeptidase regulatory-like domain-containing protein [Natrinema soli]